MLSYREYDLEKIWRQSGDEGKKIDSWCLFEDYSPTLMEVSGKLSISCNMSWADSSGYQRSKVELQVVLGAGRYNKNIAQGFTVDKRLNCGRAVKFSEVSHFMGIF